MQIKTLLLIYVAILIGSLPKLFYLIWSQYDVPGGINESLEGLILFGLISIVTTSIIALIAIAGTSLFGIKLGKLAVAILAFAIGIVLSFL